MWDFRFRDEGFWISDFEIYYFGCGISDFEIQDLRFWILDFGFRDACFRDVGISEIRNRISKPKIHSSQHAEGKSQGIFHPTRLYSFRICDFGFREAGFVILDFGFRDA